MFLNEAISDSVGFMESSRGGLPKTQELRCLVDWTGQDGSIGTVKGIRATIPYEAPERF